MIKLKDLLTENRIRNIEQSEIAHVNKEFERLVKGISKSWDIETDNDIYNFNDGTRNFKLSARWGKNWVSVHFNLSSLPAHIPKTEISVHSGGRDDMDINWKIKVDDDTDLVKLFKKESKIKSNVKKTINKIEKLTKKEAEAQTKYYRSIGGVPAND